MADPFSDAAITAALGRQMTRAVQRQAVAASNLANLDTPGYRTKEITFAAALDDELGASGVITSDPRHFGAYMKAEAVLARLEQAGTAGADALRLAPVAQPFARRRTVLMGAAAAGLAIAAGGAVTLRRLLEEEVYSTNIGETREVVLSDGSIVTLRTTCSYPSVSFFQFSTVGGRKLAVFSAPGMEVPMNGPSIWAPSTAAPAVSPLFIAWSIDSSAKRVVSRVSAASVGKKPVMPWAASVRDMPLSASAPPAALNPPAPWIWASRYPGTTVLPVRSVPVPEILPTSAILPSSTRISAT